MVKRHLANREAWLRDRLQHVGVSLASEKQFVHHPRFQLLVDVRSKSDYLHLHLVLGTLQ